VVEGVAASGIWGAGSRVRSLAAMMSSCGVRPSIASVAGDIGVEGGSAAYVDANGEGVGDAVEVIVGVVGMLLEFGIGSVTPRAVA